MYSPSKSSIMRFSTLTTCTLAATAFASPVITAERAAVADNSIANKEAAPVVDLVKKDTADEISSDLGKLVGDLVYDTEGVLKAFGYDTTEFFNEIGLEPQTSPDGVVVDGATLIIHLIKNLGPLAFHLGIHLLELITAVLV